MAWEAPYRKDVVDRLAAQNPDLIRYHDIDFCILVATELNKEEPGKWGLNGKRGNPNDKSRDVVAYLNPEVPWGCSIVDIIGGHDNNSGAPVSPAWIDQTRTTFNGGTKGIFIPITGMAPPVIEPPVVEPPIVQPPNPPTTMTCNFKETISREEFDSLKSTVDDTNRKISELHQKLMGQGDGSLNDILVRLDRNLGRINDTGCRSPFQR